MWKKCEKNCEKKFVKKMMTKKLKFVGEKIWKKIFVNKKLWKKSCWKKCEKMWKNKKICSKKVTYVALSNIYIRDEELANCYLEFENWNWKK